MRGDQPCGLWLVRYLDAHRSGRGVGVDVVDGVGDGEFHVAGAVRALIRSVAPKSDAWMLPELVVAEKAVTSRSVTSMLPDSVLTWKWGASRSVARMFPALTSTRTVTPGGTVTSWSAWLVPSWRKREDSPVSVRTPSLTVCVEGGCCKTSCVRW